MPQIKLSITLEGEPELIMPVYTAVILAAGSIDIDPGSEYNPGGVPRWNWRNHPPKTGNPAAAPAPDPDDRWLDFSIFPNIEAEQVDDLKAWLEYALRRHRPYSLLVISGPPGSGKSTLSRILKDFIEGTRLRVTVYDALVDFPARTAEQISTTLAETPVIVNTLDDETLHDLRSVMAPGDDVPAPVFVKLTRPIEESERKPGIETLGFRS